MKITVRQLRQLIKEEVTRVLLENAGGLVINSAEYETEYNDPDLGSQQSKILLTFTYKGEGKEATKRFTYFDQSEETVIEDITFAINYAIDPDAEEPIVNEATVKEVLGKERLQKIMNEFEKDADAYNNPLY